MGRGRAKAKQTKVARALKYTTTGTDLDRLQRELASNGDGSYLAHAESDPLEDDESDEWDDDDDSDED
jgi:hypothetical protein